LENVLEWSRTVLETTPARWLELTEKLPAELLTRPPAAGEWSAVGCLQHLIDTERGVFPVRINAILAGQDFPAFNPDSEGAQPAADQSPAALAREFARLRREGLAALAQVTAADLDRQARHSELGLVTMRQLIYHWAGHDLMHTVQAERALMQSFIDGCGPWRRYFTDHIAQPGG